MTGLRELFKLAKATGDRAFSLRLESVRWLHPGSTRGKSIGDLLQRLTQLQCGLGSCPAPRGLTDGSSQAINAALILVVQGLTELGPEFLLHRRLLGKLFQLFDGFQWIIHLVHQHGLGV